MNLAFKIEKADLMEGMKVAKKVIGKSAAKIDDATIGIAGSGNQITLRACFPGLCYLDWLIRGDGDANAIPEMIVPLDKLRGVTDRMPAEIISMRIDPKNNEKLKLQCGKRSAVIPIRLEAMNFREIEKDAKLTHEGEMKPLIQTVRLFNNVSLGGFNAWGCVCATPNGTGYITDEGNMLVMPFPLVEKASHPLMLPTKVLVPATMLEGKVKVLLTDKKLCLKNDRWAYMVVTTYVKVPGYEKIVEQFLKHKRAPIDMDPLSKEVRDFRKACKNGSLIVNSKAGKLSVRASRDASIAYKSEREIGSSPDFEFTVIPENYLKVGPCFKKDTEIAVADGSHLFLKSGDTMGIISCLAGTIKFS